MKAIILILLLALPMAAEKKKTPAYDPNEITHGCVQVTGVKSQLLNLWTGPNVHGTAINHCNRALTISLTIAYFWKDASQAGTSIARETVAAGARWDWVVTPAGSFWPVKGARVIDVTP